MKRFGFITLMYIFILSLAWMAWAAPTPVKDTRHNLSTSGTGSYKSDSLPAGGTSEICVFCHTPHGGNTDAPLWNRTNVGSITPYTSDVMSALSSTLAGDSDLGVGLKHVKTRICLSCHDGTIAMGQCCKPSSRPYREYPHTEYSRNWFNASSRCRFYRNQFER